MKNFLIQYFLRWSTNLVGIRGLLNTNDKFVKRIPASIVYTIIKLFIIEKNAPKTLRKPKNEMFIHLLIIILFQNF